MLKEVNDAMRATITGLHEMRLAEKASELTRRQSAMHLRDEFQRMKELTAAEKEAQAHAIAEERRIQLIEDERKKELQLEKEK